MKKYNIMKFFTLLIVLICITLTKAQTNCTYYYDITNLPVQCDPTQLICTFNSIANSSLINGTGDNQFLVCINLPTYTISFGPQPQIDLFENSISIIANTVNMNGYSLVSQNQIVVIAGQSITMESINMKGDLVWFQSDQLQLSNSVITNSDSFPINCNCNGVPQCNLTQWFLPLLFDDTQSSINFTMDSLNYTFDTWNIIGNGASSAVLAANSSININNSTLSLSLIGIYAPILNLQSANINSSGLGFASGNGFGCGYFDQSLSQLLGCTGTGGSHGGYGGNSSPDNCNLLISNPPYGRALIPKYPGSGGGFFLNDVNEVSSGGGVINIQSMNFTMMSTNITANGAAGIQGGGGGAGGSISIDFGQLQFIGTTPNFILANGGNGRSSGGGGRMRIWNHYWLTPSGLTPGYNVSIQANFGGDCYPQLSCGQSGSISAAPCPPGFYLNQSSLMCVNCGTGQYKLTYGYGSCFDCINMPENAFYNATSLSQQTNYSQVCSFSCIQNYQLYEGELCLSNFYYLLMNVGGINFLISLGLIVATVIIFLIVIMIRKLSASALGNENQYQHIDVYKKRSYFKLEDIPFHETRIYLQGNNTPKRPWKISPKAVNTLRQTIQNQKNREIIHRLIQQINQFSTYGWFLQYFLFFVKIVYYPMSLFLSAVYRQRKVQSIRNAILAHSKQLVGSIGVKFHVNKEHSVGCLQVFNYNRQILDFYIKNYFPMYFKLSKQLIGGYAVDFTDPLVKVLCSQFQDYYQKKMQIFLMQLNTLLKNYQQPIPVFKHLWKTLSYWQELQCFLWQAPRQQTQFMANNGILGIEGRLTINKNQDLFLVFCNEVKPQAMIQQQRNNQSRFSRHFLYKTQLPSLCLDEISCIRYKYSLRDSHQLNQKKTIFWQIQNNVNMQVLTWIMGIVAMVNLICNLICLFLKIFIMAEYHNTKPLFSLLIFFIIFPFCEIFMSITQFSLIVAKSQKVLSYSVQFTFICAIKYFVFPLIILIITIVLEIDNPILNIMFYCWLAIFLMNVLSLILQCMFHVHIAKNK